MLQKYLVSDSVEEGVKAIKDLKVPRRYLRHYFGIQLS